MESMELLDQFTDADGDSVVLFGRFNAPEWFVMSIYGGTQCEPPDGQEFDDEETAREWFRSRVEYWQSMAEGE